jgi:hypothetical protein
LGLFLVKARGLARASAAAARLRLIASTNSVSSSERSIWSDLVETAAQARMVPPAFVHKNALKKPQFVRDDVCPSGIAGERNCCRPGKSVAPSLWLFRWQRLPCRARIGLGSAGTAISTSNLSDRSSSIGPTTFSSASNSGDPGVWSSVASTHLPPSLLLFATGFGVFGLLRWLKNRKAVASA